MASYIRCVTTVHHYKRISSQDLGLKELRIFRMEVILALLVASRSEWCDHFQEFDRLVARLALSFFKNSNGVLMIRQIFLEVNLFEVDSALRRLEALAEL